MRRPNREIQIFSLSMLDVMTGALGAVLILMVVFSTRPEEVPEIVDPERLRQLEEQVRRLEKRRPVAVQVWWLEDGQDIDVYVQSGDSRDPGPKTGKQAPRFPGDASVDAKGGFRSETWLMRDMPAGPYKVFVKLMTAPGQAKTSQVWAAFLYQQKMHKIGQITVRPDRPIAQVATLTMDRQGNLTTERSSAAQEF